jgi:hypothetical protein
LLRVSGARGDRGEQAQKKGDMTRIACRHWVWRPLVCGIVSWVHGFAVAEPIRLVALEQYWGDCTPQNFRHSEQSEEPL